MCGECVAAVGQYLPQREVCGVWGKRLLPPLAVGSGPVLGYPAAIILVPALYRWGTPGALAIERVYLLVIAIHDVLFSLDGLGLLSYESVLKRDYPVVLGTLYLFTMLGLIAKLLADISYVMIDPRIHFDSVDD